MRKDGKIHNFFSFIKKTNKNGEEITKTVSYKLKFIDSARFMTSLLLNLICNLTDFIKLA